MTYFRITSRLKSTCTRSPMTSGLKYPPGLQTALVYKLAELCTGYPSMRPPGSRRVQVRPHSAAPYANCAANARRDWFQRSTLSLIRCQRLIDWYAGAHMLLLRDSQDVSVEEDDRGGLRLVHSTSAPALVLPWKEEGVSIATISFTVTTEFQNDIQGCRVSDPEHMT
jgi:hypothetical protein